MATNILYILRGASGSGKTTEANRLRADGAVQAHYEADMWHDLYNSGVWDPTNLGKAHGWCLWKVKEALLEGKNVVVANTFIKRKDMKPYVEFASEHGIQVIEKIMEGEFQNVHGVPPEKVEQMRKGLQR